MQDVVIVAATRTAVGNRPIKAVLDPYNPTGTTARVNFNTSKTERYETGGPPPKCQVNWVILDSDWEGEFCRVVESHPRVRAYVKNHSLGFEVPYRFGGEARRFRPFVDLYHDAYHQIGGTPKPLGVHSPGLVADTDEAAREAHKASWFYGGTGGLAVGGVFIILASTPPAARLTLPAWFDGRTDPAAYAATGAVGLMTLMLIGYGVVWGWWWLARR